MTGAAAEADQIGVILADANVLYSHRLPAGRGGAGEDALARLAGLAVLTPDDELDILVLRGRRCHACRTRLRASPR